LSSSNIKHRKTIANPNHPHPNHTLLKKEPHQTTPQQHQNPTTTTTTPKHMTYYKGGNYSGIGFKFFGFCLNVLIFGFCLFGLNVQLVFYG
jgi:hypothetical protein